MWNHVYCYMCRTVLGVKNFLLDVGNNRTELLTQNETLKIPSFVSLVFMGKKYTELDMPGIKETKIST